MMLRVEMFIDLVLKTSFIAVPQILLFFTKKYQDNGKRLKFFPTPKTHQMGLYLNFIKQGIKGLKIQPLIFIRVHNYCQT